MAVHAEGSAPMVVAAEPAGSYLQLINNTKSTRNTVWFDQTAASPSRSITAEFDYKIFGGIRGDGLAFGLASTDYFGPAGAGTPVDGEDIFDEKGRLEESLAIAFDTYENSNHGDPSNNSVSVHFDGQLIATFEPNFDLHSATLTGFDHAVLQVDFIPVGVEVSLDLKPFGRASQQVIDSLLIPGLTPYASRAAFGARTGEGTAFIAIDNLNVAFVPEPSSLMLVGLFWIGSAGRRNNTSYDVPFR